MKICVLSEYFYPDSTGGSGTVLSNLVRRLKDEYADLEIDVITSRNLFRGEAQSLPTSEDWKGVHILRLGSPQPLKRSIRRRLTANMVFTGAVLRTLVRQRKQYDLVLVATAPPTLALAARAYHRLTGTPYIYLIYDLYLDMALVMQMVRHESRLIQAMQKVQKSWLGSASRVVVLGRCMSDLIADRYGVSPEKIDVVPIPSDISRIQPQDKESRFRQSHGLSGFVVLYAGNFAQYQDFDTLLDAAQMQKHRSDITWVFVGDGAKRAHIEARIHSEELSNVRVLGFVPEEDLCDLLASADVSLVSLESGVAGLAVPSKFYNILASGRPTVAVVDSFSEIARVIDESGCGLRVAPEDARGLALAIESLAEDPRAAEEMGLAARRICESLYSLPHIAHRFHDLFQQVAQHRAHPSQPTSLIQPLNSSQFKTQDRAHSSEILSDAALTCEIHTDFLMRHTEADAESIARGLAKPSTP